MSSVNKTELIRLRLESAFSPTFLEVLDESDQHLGHAGHGGGGRHFAVTISAEYFRGKSRVASHQAVYALFNDLMPHEIHALRIKII
jgi:BolA protein